MPNRIRGWGRKKPGPEVRPDFTHPLCPPFAGGMIYLCNTIKDGTKTLKLCLQDKSDVPDVAKTAEGTANSNGAYGCSAFNFAFNGTYGVKASLTNTWMPTTAITVLMGYRKVNQNNNASSAFGLSVAASAINRLNCHLPFSDGIIYWDFGGFTVGSSRLTWSGWTVDLKSHIWCFTAGTRGMEIWQDGYVRASNAGNPTRSTTTDAFYLGGGTGQVTDGATLDFFYMWPTQLPTAKIVQLTANPFAFFPKRPSERAFAIVRLDRAAPLYRSGFAPGGLLRASGRLQRSLR